MSKLNNEDVIEIACVFGEEIPLLACVGLSLDLSVLGNPENPSRSSRLGFQHTAQVFPSSARLPYSLFLQYL